MHSLSWDVRKPEPSRFDRTFQFQRARVAKSADAKDLKSFSPQGECGFKSRPGHQLIHSKPAEFRNAKADKSEERRKKFRCILNRNRWRADV
jgi:hypothetical protein